MLDSLTPPTDNLYKFIAIGSLAFALVAFIYVLREGAAQREAYVAADIELRANGYTDPSAQPKSDQVELLKAWYHREYAKQGGAETLKLANGLAGNAAGCSLMFSMFGFAAWGWRVQRHEDAMLRFERTKLERGS